MAWFGDVKPRLRVANDKLLRILLETSWNFLILFVKDQVIFLAMLTQAKVIIRFVTWIVLGALYVFKPMSSSKYSNPN